MGQPLLRRATTGVDDMLRAKYRFIDREPAQGQSELRVAATEFDIAAKRANLQLHIRERDYRVRRLLEETARQSDNVARENKINDLAPPIVQKLIAGGESVFDEAQLPIFVTVNDKIAAFLDDKLGLYQAPKAFQIAIAQIEAAF